MSTRKPMTSWSWRGRCVPACPSPPPAPPPPSSSRPTALRRRCIPAETSPTEPPFPTTTTPAAAVTAPQTSRATCHASSGRPTTTAWHSPWTPTTCTASREWAPAGAASALWDRPFQRRPSATTPCGAGAPSSKASASFIADRSWPSLTWTRCRAKARNNINNRTTSSPAFVFVLVFCRLF